MKREYYVFCSGSFLVYRWLPQLANRDRKELRGKVCFALPWLYTRLEVYSNARSRTERRWTPNLTSTRVSFRTMLLTDFYHLGNTHGALVITRRAPQGRHAEILG